MLRIARSLLVVAMALATSNLALAGPLDDAEFAFEEQHYETALQIWQPPANQGNTQAQFGLGALFSAKKDYIEALKWYRRAADQGYPRAQHHLAFLYFAGLHVPQDYVLSYMWENLAAAQGEMGARESRDRIAADMTREQIAEAQRLARDWKPIVWSGTDAGK
jgi:TPR repeat protein